MDYGFEGKQAQLRKIRATEIEMISEIIKKYCSKAERVLEIGAGTGSQSKILSKKFEVSAIDIESSRYNNANQEYKVESYDGINIPFSDNSFDIIYSSNVLEHVVYLKELNEEIKRVLKPNGLVIHILPSSFWAFCHVTLYYPHVIRLIIKNFKNISYVKAYKQQRYENKENSVNSNRILKLIRKFFYYLYPKPHGEFKSALQEIIKYNRIM